MIACDMDPPKFYVWTEPVARKQHKCVECRALINVGEKHFAYRGMWNDSIETGRQHLLCCEACMLIRDAFEGGDCICFGSLKEHFGELNYNREHDRCKPKWKRLRSLMAKILWRERGAS